MNRLILSLPKQILRNYVISHFPELSVEDFFEVSKKIEVPSTCVLRNDTLSKDSSVLSYVLDIDKDAFRYFKKEAFSEECINKLADLEIKIYPTEIDNYPMLLNNNKILERLLYSFPEEVKRLKENQITDKIISILEKTYFVPDEEDIEKSSLFLKSETLLKRAIKTNPNLILKAENLSESLATTALDSGFVPEKQHFYFNPQLRMSNELLQKAFENDPSVIVLFDENQLSEKNIYSAYIRGYVASEKDLIENPSLCHFKDIMQPAITDNPKLITLTAEECYLDYNIVLETLKKYKITKEDLEKNPALTKNSSIIKYLPEFKLYSAFLKDEEKQEALINSIKLGDPLTVEELPFLDYKFGAKSDIKKLSELCDYLKLHIDEKDLNFQQNYFQMLDKIIDGVVSIRYDKKKPSFEYSDIVSLNEHLIELFDNVEKTKNFELISKFVKDLYFFIGETLSIEQIKSEIEKFYTVYIEKQSIDLNITNEFCNKILNLHRNYFMSKEKEKILKQVESKMNLTEKKKNTILNGRKLKKIRELIINKDFEQLGITEEVFRKEIENTKKVILNNKDVKKSGILMDSSDLKSIEECFIRNGHLTDDLVSYGLGVNNSDITKFISNKFEQIKFKLVNNVTLSDEESCISQWEKSKLGGLNHTNYIIGDNDRYLRNLSELLLKSNDNLLNKILDNKNLIGEVADLLPLLNLIEEFDVNNFINILCEYERVRNKIIGLLSNQENIDYKNHILKNMNDLINLANAYSSVDDITLSALGRNVVSEIGEYSSSEYLEFYLKMLNKHRGSIPPIFIQTSDYYLESGRYSDPERLLIGKKPDKDSCIDLLNSAGERTYREVLLEDSGDVILVKNNQNELLSRILVFRRGNIIQMVTNARGRISIKFYKEIANQIIKNAIAANDNIDYVFVSSYSFTGENKSYNEVEDIRFVTNFPHADFFSTAVLLSSKSEMLGYKESNINLKFDEDTKVPYIKLRKKISYQPTETDITRLRALSVIMESDLETKENKARKYEPFYMKEYDKVICGEDWYVAVKKDGSFEELILPSNDPRTYEEVEQVKETLNFSNNVNKLP